MGFGEVYQTSPQTTPPTYTVDVLLCTAGTWGATGTAVGAQFDLNYSSALTVSVSLPPAIAAIQQLNMVSLPQPYNPYCVNPGQPTCLAADTPSGNTASGMRVVIIGCSIATNGVCSSSSTNPTSNLMPDGVIATLTVKGAATPTATNEIITMPSIYLGATTQGISAAATNIGLTITGPNDGGTPANGQINLNGLYMVGSLTPYSGNNSFPNFGSGKIQITDTLDTLFYQTGASGYNLSAIPTCSDFFDAMDADPQDSATGRGGDGAITILDTLDTLYRQTGASGYGTLPLRAPRGLVCSSSTTAHVVHTPPETRATLTLGPTQGAGTAQETVPIYLEGMRDLSGVVISFSIGDDRSQLHFQQAADLAPDLKYDGTGFVTAAFLSGFNVRAGGRTLLGYVVGPAGSASNFRIMGTSAATLNDRQMFGVEFAGSGTVRQ
jgi:hypothetical protein